CQVELVCAGANSIVDLHDNTLVRSTCTSTDLPIQWDADVVSRAGIAEGVRKAQKSVDGDAPNARTSASDIGLQVPKMAASPPTRRRGASRIVRALAELDVC